MLFYVEKAAFFRTCHEKMTAKDGMQFFPCFFLLLPEIPLVLVYLCIIIVIKFSQKMNPVKSWTVWGFFCLCLLDSGSFDV